MNIKLTVGDGNAVFIKRYLNGFLHIIENIPVIVAVAPDKAGNVYRACGVLFNGNERLGVGENKIVGFDNFFENFFCLTDIGIV